MKHQKTFAFYHTLKGVVCFRFLDAQDANSTLKCGVFATHLDIKKRIIIMKKVFYESP